MKKVEEFSRYIPTNDKKGRSKLKTHGYRKQY